jgi:hypothetical protein
VKELIDLLSDLMETPSDIRDVARLAALSTRHLRLEASPYSIWMAVLEEARKQEKIGTVLEIMSDRYPAARDKIRNAVAGFEGPNIPDRDWRGFAEGAEALEKLMGKQATFLPIAFLEIGLARSRAVARIARKGGLGSGFLISGNVLLTNFHVLPSAEAASEARVQFNFQQTHDGLSAEVDEYELNPDAGFAVSPANGGDDWAAVRLKGNPGARWGEIALAETSVAANDYVNIIQHPQGMPKQIALYHNIVTYADDRRVQYLTDTLPGSSGSPVFDSLWRLVALHHSGGWLSEPGTKKVLFRNEGIAAKALLSGLNAAGLLK